MTRFDPELTRRESLGIGAAATGLTTGSQPPLVSSFVPTMSSAARLAIEQPDEQITFGGDNLPTWIVGIESNDDDDDDDDDSNQFDDLRAWAGDTDEDDDVADRHVLDTFPALDVAVVAADPGATGVSFLNRLRGDGLAGRSWVRFVDANVRMDLIEPLQSFDLEDDLSDLEFDDDPGIVFDRTPDVSGLATDDDVEEQTVGDGWEAVDGREHGVEHDDLRVAVIDTGVTDHDIFEETVEDPDNGEMDVTRILDASADTTGDGITTVEEEGLEVVEDGDGHGNWVASSMLADPDDERAEYRGALPEARILAIKALDDDGSGSTESIIRAVEHATDEDADVACMSLGTPFYSHALADAIETATDEGTIPVAAAGNDRFGTTFPGSPASVEDSIAVSASTADADPDEAQIAYFANAGPHDGFTDQSGGDSAGATPDLAAPGMDLEARVPDGFDTLTGTSMAAPYVAAAAGVLIADGVDPEDVRDRLNDTADRMEQAAVNETLHGRLNLASALADDESEDDQADVMDSDAEERNVTLEAYSGARGGFINRVLE